MGESKNELKLYRVLPKYVRALQDEKNGGDRRVYDVCEGKENRPFVGIVVVCNGQKYCIPLTTPKKKFENMKGRIDFGLIVINGEIKAAIEYSRMIPVTDNQIRIMDMEAYKKDSQKRKRMKQLRKTELAWCREHSEEIINKANVLYNTYISGTYFKRRADCLDFPRLEKICEQYQKKHPGQYPSFGFPRTEA